MKRVTFHSEAEWDLHQAVGYYETLRTGLGLELSQEVEAAILRVLRNPQAFTVHDSKRGIRKCLVRRFPYTVFFTEYEETLWIAAIAHQSRKPHYWHNRRPE